MKEVITLPSVLLSLLTCIPGTIFVCKVYYTGSDMARWSTYDNSQNVFRSYMSQQASMPTCAILLPPPLPTFPICPHTSCVRRTLAINEGIAPS